MRQIECEHVFTLDGSCAGGRRWASISCDRWPHRTKWRWKPAALCEQPWAQRRLVGSVVVQCWEALQIQQL